MGKSRTKPRVLPVGEIGHDTLVPWHLIPALVNASQGVRLTKADRRTVQYIEKQSRRLHKENVESDWDSSLLGRLYSVLDDYIPAYCYLGTAEGDAACIGVWVEWYRVNEEARYQGDGDIFKLPADGVLRSEDEYLLAMRSGKDYWLRVNDHGNATLLRRAGNVWRTEWEVV